MKRSAYQAENVFGTLGPKKQEHPETFPIPEHVRGYRIFRRSEDARNSGWRVPGKTTRPDRTLREEQPRCPPLSPLGMRGPSPPQGGPPRRGEKKRGGPGDQPPPAVGSGIPDWVLGDH